MRKPDFYTVAAPIAFIVGFVWVYLCMAVLKVPAWPAMVGMAGYYAVGGLACHERHDNAAKSVKGLLLGSMASWIAVLVWTLSYKGSPGAMGVVMGVLVLVFVLITKWRFMGDHQFIALPQTFLGATIYFGLFNSFMMAKGAPDGLLFGLLQPLALKGGAQPHVAGVLAVLSGISGVLLGYVHQNVSLRVVEMAGSSGDESK